jgi:cholesterol transport system auxiliary component
VTFRSLCNSATLLLLPLLAGGCTGSLFQTKAVPPTMYLLSAGGSSPLTAGAAPAGELAADLAILKPRVRAGLDTDRIAAVYPDRRLDYFADSRWSGPLDEVIQDLVVQVFHTRAGMRNVSGDASAFASAYWLEITVTDFEAEYRQAGAAPTVRVHFQARIGSSAERRIIARFEADAEQPAGENRMTGIVAAYNQAANTALMQLATNCVAALGSDVARPGGR